MRKVSPFLELVLWRTRRWIIAPVDDCDGHFCHRLDSLPLVMGEQVVGRMSCLPLVRRADHRPCPASVMFAGVVSPCRPGRCRHRSESSSYCGRSRTSKTVVHQRLGLRSIGVTRPSSTLLLGVTWLWQSGTCPPLLHMASPHGACVKWRVEYDNEDGLR